jgi:hypothetical protein
LHHGTIFGFSQNFVYDFTLVRSSGRKITVDVVGPEVLNDNDRPSRKLSGCLWSSLTTEWVVWNKTKYFYGTIDHLVNSLIAYLVHLFDFEHYSKTVGDGAFWHFLLSDCLWSNSRSLIVIRRRERFECFNLILLGNVQSLKDSG